MCRHKMNLSVSFGAHLDCAPTPDMHYHASCMQRIHLNNGSNFWIAHHGSSNCSDPRYGALDPGTPPL
jgi:hypothetical protein